MNSADVNRYWVGALAFSVIAVAVVLAVAVVANLVIVRVIHWAIVAVLGRIGLVFLTVGRKFKTI